MSSLLVAVQELLGRLESEADDDTRTSLQLARARLDEPLRVAFAGRIKAGKSTLLNAIVGTPIAASDAAECTRYVTWYRHGPEPAAFAVDESGGRHRLGYRLGEGIDVSTLGGTVDRLEVEYPSPTLSALTLIDTPGVASISEHVSARSTDFLIPESGDQGADVLIYMFRFLHERDANFLEAFTDPSAHQNDPVRSLAVLSRADEFGSGRGDALALARAAAERYRTRSEIRGQVSDVLAVSGLIGLHAETFTADDVDALRIIAELPMRHQEQLLLSAARFGEAPVTTCSTDRRAALLARLGLTGVRLALSEYRLGEVTSAEKLTARLLDESGVAALRDLLTVRYANRSNALKASRALDLASHVVAGGLGGRTARAAIERIEANAHELTELRTLRELGGLMAQDALGGLTSQQVRMIEAALGARGVTLRERLRVADDPDVDVAAKASAAIGELRAASNSRVLPRASQRLIRAAFRSLEIALHHDTTS